MQRVVSVDGKGMKKEHVNDDEERSTQWPIPWTPYVLGPLKPGPARDKQVDVFHPITVFRQAELDRVSDHGAVVVATLATTGKLFDIVLKPNIASLPITSIKQLTEIVAGSWLFAKATIDILHAHGVKGSLITAARKDSAILVRVVVLMIVKEIVKLEGFASAKNMLLLFQFVRVAGALAESGGSKAAAFLNEIASIPMKVFSAVALLLSDAIDVRLRQALAIEIGRFLEEAQAQLTFLDEGIKLTTKNVEEKFLESYGLIDRYLRMRLGISSNVEARDILLEWRKSV